MRPGSAWWEECFPILSVLFARHISMFIPDWQDVFFNIQTETVEQMGTQKNQKLINIQSCCWHINYWKQRPPAAPLSDREKPQISVFLVFTIIRLHYSSGNFVDLVKSIAPSLWWNINMRYGWRIGQRARQTESQAKCHLFPKDWYETQSQREPSQPIPWHSVQSAQWALGKKGPMLWTHGFQVTVSPLIRLVRPHNQLQRPKINTGTMPLYTHYYQWVWTACTMWEDSGDAESVITTHNVCPAARADCVAALTRQHGSWNETLKSGIWAALSREVRPQW